MTMKPTPTPDLNIDAMRAATLAYNESLDGKHFGATERIIRAYLAALSVPAAAVVGEPVYRFLVEGDVIEATDEFVADDPHGWQPPAAWAVGMEYPSRIFKPVRRRVAAPTATEGLDEQALDKAAREGYAVRCKTHGPRVLDHYASADIMQRQLDDARVIIAAYLSALAECSR